MSIFVVSYYTVIIVSIYDEGFLYESDKTLWILLEHREMSKAELRKKAGIAPATFAKLRCNQKVALSVLLKITEVIDCDVSDMMSFVKDDVPVITENCSDITLD